MGKKTKNPNKGKICLGMIVRNEETIILKCLEKVVPIIDTWVIIDTGSTDKTCEVIETYFRDVAKKPGVLMRRPWVNFGFNRTELMKECREQARYTLMIDADELLMKVGDLPPLVADVFHCVCQDGTNITDRTVLYSNKLEWVWTGAIYEAAQVNGLGADEELKRGILQDWQLVNTREGYHARNPQRLTRTAHLLELMVLDDPNDLLRLFYLGETYRQGRKWEDAIRVYQQRKGLADDELSWVSQYNIARCKIERGDEFADLCGDLLLAYYARPNRLEPLYDLLRACRERKYYALGYDLGCHLLRNDPAEHTTPGADKQYVNRMVYLYGVLDELASCAFYTKRYQEYMDITNIIMGREEVPMEQKQRLMGNREKCREILDALDGGMTGRHREQDKSTNWSDEFRTFFAKFVREQDVKSILDVGCGQWSTLPPLPEQVQYTGVDLFENVIEANKKLLSQDAKLPIQFHCTDIFNLVEFPPGDLCLLKDVFNEWKPDEVSRIIYSVQYKYKHVLIVHAPGTVDLTELKSFKFDKLETVGDREVYKLVARNVVATVKRAAEEKVEIVKGEVVVGLMLNVSNLDEVVASLLAQDYPKDKMHVHCYGVGPGMAVPQVIKDAGYASGSADFRDGPNEMPELYLGFLNKVGNCEFLLQYSQPVPANTLKHLVEQDEGVVGPVIDHPLYRANIEQMPQLLSKELSGTFQVPGVVGVYLIHHEVARDFAEFYRESGDPDFVAMHKFAMKEKQMLFLTTVPDA